MKSSHDRWLLDQLPQWEEEGLLTPEGAGELRRRHESNLSEKDGQPALAQMVMGGIGALLVGCGLIAVIGYNWDTFPRWVRMLFAFLPLLAAQGFSFWTIRRGPGAADWVRECAALLQTFATGSSIAIVSQLYNLGREWTGLLFVWMLLILPLAWAMRSKAVVLFYLAALATWSIAGCYPHHAWWNSPALSPLLLAALLPLWPGWPPRNAPSPFMRWIIAACALASLACTAVWFAGNAGDSRQFVGETFTWQWSLTAASLILFPLTSWGLAESVGRKPQVVLGTLWLLGYGIALTFREVGNDLSGGISQSFRSPWTWILLVTVAAFAFRSARQGRWAILALAGIALLPSLATFVSGGVSGVFTLYLFTLGLSLILLEFSGHRGSPRMGATILAILVIARMADSDFSLLIKGLVFIGVGIAFIAFNIVMGRLRRRRASNA